MTESESWLTTNARVLTMATATGPCPTFAWPRTWKVRKSRNATTFLPCSTTTARVPVELTAISPGTAPCGKEMVLTTGATEEVRIPREEIEDVQPGKVSIMPAGLDQQLAPRDLADLVAFLKACR